MDGHNDFPWAVRTRARSSLEEADPRQHLDRFHTDIHRLREGGVGAQFWSVFVPAWTEEPLAVTLQQIDLVDGMVALAPDHFERTVTAADVAAARGRGRIACLTGAEGGHCIENSLDGLGRLAERGVRYLTLTHGDSLDWADSATDVARNGGLTDFGRTVVKEMNRLGMVVDISHVSVPTMRHALETTERPLMASHSNAEALTHHPRNIPDDILEKVAANGGVVMVNFYPGFLVTETADRALNLLSLTREMRPCFDDDEELEDAVADRLDTEDWDRGTVADVCDHIDHIARVAGVDHVGIGSDFDGINLTPVGLEDVSRYWAVTAELLSRGWQERAIRQVLGENAMRVLAAND